jgi:hypothetical protein
MLLVSPVTWDTSLPLLLVPIAVTAQNASRSRWTAIGLLVIFTVVWAPQQALTKLALGGRTVHILSWAFMMGAPSLKSFALLGLSAIQLLGTGRGLSGLPGSTALQWYELHEGGKSPSR